jgi:hypothetical protein
MFHLLSCSYSLILMKCFSSKYQSFRELLISFTIPPFPCYSGTWGRGWNRSSFLTTHLLVFNQVQDGGRPELLLLVMALASTCSKTCFSYSYLTFLSELTFSVIFSLVVASSSFLSVISLTKSIFIIYSKAVLRRPRHA